MSRTPDVKQSDISLTLATIAAQGLAVAEIIIEPKRVRILTVASPDKAVPQGRLKSWD